MDFELGLGKIELEISWLGEKAAWSSGFLYMIFCDGTGWDGLTVNDTEGAMAGGKVVSDKVVCMRVFYG